MIGSFVKKNLFEMTDAELFKERRYLKQKYEKYLLMEASLTRQLEETDVKDSDWEELYEFLMNVREKRDETISRIRYVERDIDERNREHFRENHDAAMEELRKRSDFGFNCERPMWK